MVKLIAQTPANGALPITIGALTLSEYAPKSIHAIMPFEGADGLCPPPGQTHQSGQTLTIWAGHRLALMLNAEEIPQNAAVSDQSDAWAVFDLSGPGIETALARLCPVDTRPAQFPTGQTARTLLGHMNASLTRMSDDTIRIMMFRSMAKTAVHDLTRAMEHAQR